MPISKIPFGALQSGTVQSSNIADGAVTSAKIGDGQVLTAKLEDEGKFEDLKFLYKIKELLESIENEFK